jgi:hypothetical protein
MAETPSTLDSEKSQQISGLYHEAGIFEVKNNVQYDPFGSAIPDDRSYLLMQDKFKNLIQFIGGGITIKAVGNMGTFVNGNFYKSVKGDTQHVHGGDHHTYTHGDTTHQHGKHSPDKVQAAKNLQTQTKKIDQHKIDVTKNTTGDMVPCYVCQQKMLTDRAQNLTDKAFNLLKNFLPNFPFSWDIIQRYVDMLVVPMLSLTTNNSLNGGNGCGSPGCKNGQIESPASSIQAGNQAGQQMFQDNQQELNQYQQQLGSGGSSVVSHGSGDVMWKFGLAKNDSPITADVGHHVNQFGFNNAKNPADGFTTDTKGSTKRIAEMPCLVNPGSLFMDISNKFTLATGSPGIDIHTTGKAQINAAITTITSTEGELTLTSQNVTTLKGKNVLIEAKDRSGDTGVQINSDNTMVMGKLSVSGDLALKGSIMMDGGMYCTHLTVPGERIPTQISGDAHQVHSSPTWSNPINPQGAIFDTIDKIYKAISRDLAAIATFLELTPNLIKTWVIETYFSTLIIVPIDNFGVPTGIAEAISCDPIGGIPIDVLWTVTMTVDGPAVGWVIPGQFLPVQSFPHNHASPGTDHSHDQLIPQGHYYSNSGAAKAARPNPSNVPNPAKPTGMGTKPGHKTLGDLTSCIIGGGGVGGGAPDIGAAINARNAKYGINGDAYNGENYVDATTQFTPDGEMVPPPHFNLFNC